MNCLNILANARFLLLLLHIDRLEAQKYWGKICPHCNKGELFWGNWIRKLRIPGLQGELPNGFTLRFSLCCSHCRKRVSPISLRFAGRSPNLIGMIALARVLVAGPSKTRIAQACKTLGISERTLRRWLRFWRRVETESAWWKNLAGLWFLSGGSFTDLWEKVRKGLKSLLMSILQIIKLLSRLWIDKSTLLS